MLYIYMLYVLCLAGGL